MANDKETCDLKEAASLLNCHPQTVVKYVKKVN